MTTPLPNSLLTIGITTSVAFGVIVWDFIQLLPNELHFYRMSTLSDWKLPSSWAFIFLRYFAIASALSSVLVSVHIHGEHCQLALSISQSCAIVVVASSGIIFGARVSVMWKHRIEVVTIVMALYAIMIGCWVAVASQYRAVSVSTPFGSECRPGLGVRWFPISYASSLAYTTTTLALAIAAPDKPSRRSLIYFTTAALANVVCLATDVIKWQDTLLRHPSLPYFVLVMSAMGSRVFFFDWKRGRVATQGVSSPSARADVELGTEATGPNSESFGYGTEAASTRAPKRTSLRFTQQFRSGWIGT